MSTQQKAPTAVALQAHSAAAHKRPPIGQALLNARLLLSVQLLSITRLLLIASLAIVLSGVYLPFTTIVIVNADGPEEGAADTYRRPRKRGTPRRTLLLPVCYAIRLAASEDGPYFSLSDLHKRPLPKRERLLSSMIPTHFSQHYPPILQGVPISPRAYSPETITYLAEHEIHHGDPQTASVALTFDCESGVQSTRQILETLRQENVQATFFILGKYAYMYPHLIREIVVDGHELGNHSFFHPLFTAITAITATQEITYTEAAIDWAVGQHVPMRYIRFPYGGRNDALLLHVATMGYQSAFWSLDPRGWEPDKTAQDVVTYVRSTAHGGGIIIMHCGCWDDANALSDVIHAIRAKGLSPGSLSDVLTEQDRNILGLSPPG